MLARNDARRAVLAQGQFGVGAIEVADLVPRQPRLERRLEPAMAEQLHIAYPQHQPVGDAAVGHRLHGVAEGDGEVAEMPERRDAVRRFGDEQRIGAADQALAPAIHQPRRLGGAALQQQQRFGPGERGDGNVDAALQPERRERLTHEADPALVFDGEQAGEQSRQRGGAEHQVVVAAIGHEIS